MKKLVVAIALTFAFTAQAASVYETPFNEDGFSTVQTDHVYHGSSSQGPTTVFWFMPAPGTDGHTYLIQVRNGSDSPQSKYDAVLSTIEGQTVSIQHGFYPSFYLTVGTDIEEGRYYLLQVNSTWHAPSSPVANRSGSARLYPDNKQVLIQRIAP
jgi:hypothetical protein